MHAWSRGTPGCVLRRAGRELLRNQIMMAATRLSIVIDSGADCRRRSSVRHTRTSATSLLLLSFIRCPMTCVVCCVTVCDKNTRSELVK